MNELQTPTQPSPSISLDCPWCATVLLVDEADLDRTIRCDSCSIGFDLGYAQIEPARSASLAAAA